MSGRPRIFEVRRSLRGLAVALALLTALALASNARAAAQACDGFESADGCLVTITGGDTPDPDDGYLVADRDGIPFWIYYRDHGPQVLGYPVSQRFIYKGFVAQAFQKAILQWRPELDRVARMNTLDVLARDYPDISLANVPAHRTLPQDEGATFQQITANHRAILAADPTIERAFLDEPQWLDRFGLPIAYAEFQGGALSVLRAQRTVLQVWRVAAAGVTPGRVSLQNVADKLKALPNVIIPDAAEAPVTRTVAEAGLILATLPPPPEPADVAMVDEAALAAPEPPAGPGLSGYGMQAEFRRSNDFGLIDLVSGAGFNWIKQQVTWSDVELEPGRYVWKEMDRLVNNMHDGGVNILLSVIKSPDFYKPKHLAGQAGPPSDLTKFHRFMFLLAERYRGKVQAFEIWNEPNFAREWGTVHAGAPNEYLQMLRLGYRAVKEANPDAIVVSGALTPTGINDPAIAVDDKVYLQRLLSINQGEAARYFDALGVHVTAGPNAPDDSVANPAHSRETCNGGWANHSSFFFTRYQELYEVMRAAGITDKPIWITEVGWPVAANPAPNFGYARCISEQDQASFLVRAFEKARTETPYVTHMFVWNLNFQQVFGPDDERWAFAIVRADQSPRPAYLALQSMPKFQPG